MILGMGIEHLTPEQRAELLRIINGQIRWYHKLVRRMQRLRFAEDDPLWREGMAMLKGLYQMQGVVMVNGQKEEQVTNIRDAD